MSVRPFTYIEESQLPEKSGKDKSLHYTVLQLCAHTIFVVSMVHIANDMYMSAAQKVGQADPKSDHGGCDGESQTGR